MRMLTSMVPPDETARTRPGPEGRSPRVAGREPPSTYLIPMVVLAALGLVLAAIQAYQHLVLTSLRATGRSRRAGRQA